MKRYEKSPLKVKAKANKFGDFIHHMTWKSRLKYTFARMDKEKSNQDLQKENFEQIVEWIEKFDSTFKIPLWKTIYLHRQNNKNEV